VRICTSRACERGFSDYSRSFRVRVLSGALVCAADHIAAQRRRTDLIAATAQTFQRFDVLLSAASLGPAPLLTAAGGAGSLWPYPRLAR
jgi:hypothetical protein